MSKKSIAQLKRDSKMLDQILGIVADMVHEDDRPMFDAILTYWRNGWKTMTPIERVALDDRRRDWRICYAPGPLEKCQKCPYYDDDCQSYGSKQDKDIVDLLMQVYSQGGDGK